MKNKIKKILKQELTRAYLGLFVCLVFTAVGIGLIVAGIHGGAFDNISSTIITGIFVLLFWGISIILFIHCLKRLVPYYQSVRALKYGIEDVATMCGYTYNLIGHHAGHRLGLLKTYYSVHLRFLDNEGNEILCKTAHNYNAEQFEQLQKMSKIKIKRHKKTAVIIEEFEDPLDYDFSELPEKLRIKSILVTVLAYISLACIIGGITCLCILDYSKAGFGILISGAVLLPFSAIFKSFIYFETENFVKNVLPNIRKANGKTIKRENQTEKENNK